MLNVDLASQDWDRRAEPVARDPLERACSVRRILLVHGTEHPHAALIEEAPEYLRTGGKDRRGRNRIIRENCQRTAWLGSLRGRHERAEDVVRRQLPAQDVASDRVIDARRWSKQIGHMLGAVVVDESRSGVLIGHDLAPQPRRGPVTEGQHHDRRSGQSDRGPVARYRRGVIRRQPLTTRDVIRRDSKSRPVVARSACGEPAGHLWRGPIVQVRAVDEGEEVVL